MFGKPDAGWTEVTISPFSEYASYITCVPMDCLDACIQYLKRNKPLVFAFDPEGPGRFFVISTNNDTYILWEDLPEAFTHVPNINARQLIAELIKDIEPSIDDWYRDFNSGDFTKEELEQKVQELKALLSK